MFTVAGSALCPILDTTLLSETQHSPNGLSLYAKDWVINRSSQSTWNWWTKKFRALKCVWDVSLDAAPLLSKLSILAVVIWGVCWPVDEMSKKSLADLPLQGEQLFGASLHNIIKNLMRGKSTFLLQSRKGEDPSHKQGLSFCTQADFSFQVPQTRDPNPS